MNNHKECWECGKVGEINSHHPVPKSRGGIKTILLCLECHAKAHHRSKNMSSGKLISQGIKASKQRAAEKGVAWVWIRPGRTMREQGRAVRMENADAYTQKIVDINQMLIESGFLTMKERHKRMVALGTKSSRGETMQLTGLYRILKRANARGIVPTCEKNKNENNS